GAGPAVINRFCCGAPSRFRGHSPVTRRSFDGRPRRPMVHGGQSPARARTPTPSMKQFFLTMLGVFAGLFLFLVVVPFLLITVAISSATSKAPTPSNTVLELDLREGVTDQTPTNPFAVFGGGGLSTMQIVDTLAQAEDDGRVKVLLIRLPEAGITPAAADEIRQAVRRFRRSGKVVIAHAQGFQPVGAAVSSYMLGASASELWMQNTSSFQLAGFSTDSIFLGRAFEKYGVNAQFEQRYEY